MERLTKRPTHYMKIFMCQEKKTNGFKNVSMNQTTLVRSSFKESEF